MSFEIRIEKRLVLEAIACLVDVLSPRFGLLCDPVCLLLSSAFALAESIRNESDNR